MDDGPMRFGGRAPADSLLNVGERDALVHLLQEWRRLVAAGVAMLLAVSLVGIVPFEAQAEPSEGAVQAREGDGQAEVDSAQATLDEAEARMGKINEEYQKLADQVAELQTRIDETAASAMEAQQAMLEGRAALGAVAVGEYRDSSSLGLLGMLLDSRDFDELIRNMEYINEIMSYQADEVAQQKERKRAFDEVSEQLNAQKNEQEQALAAQKEKRAEAEAVVAEASYRLEGAKEEHAARLSALASQAEALRKQEEEAAIAQAKAESPDANTIDRQPVVSDSAPVVSDPSDGSSGSDGDSGSGGEGGTGESGGSGGGAGAGTDSDAGAGDASDSNVTAPGNGGSSSSGSSSSAGWLSGTASAYGGSTDPYTPNPGITANGSVCNDSSMGVAVPMAMPNYRSYFGRTVEIVYGGQTVYATVTDCGYMGGGSRVLDLQPGVWKAFGFSSCRDWGLRTVKYRFL